MIARSILSDGLPPRLVERITRTFLLLDCTEPAMQALVDLLGACAQAHAIPDPPAIQRIFSLLVAASHAATRLPGPHSSIILGPSEPLPPPSEWLLLAARERAIATLPQTLGRAFDDLIAKLDEALAANPPSASAHSVLVDYGFGSLVAAIASEPDASSTCAASQCLGKLVRLALEVLLATRPAAPFLTPFLLASIVAPDHEHAARLRLAVALACKPVPDKLPIMSFLGHPDVRSRIVEACAAWTDASSKAPDHLGADQIAHLARATSVTIVQKLNSLQLFGLAKPPSLVTELDRTIHLAVEALLADPELRESWEVQRWGGPFPRTCVARVFPVGLCMLALATASIDISSPATSLLSLRCTDGYRYFEGFDGIAPDADLLGIVLQLVARIPPNPDLAASLVWPVEIVFKNTLPDGEIPVWLEQHLREPVPAGAPRWQGMRCLAVAANCAVGLLEAGVAVPDGFIDRVIGWIVRTWRTDGMRAVFFYGLPYTRFVLARLLEVAEPQLRVPSVRDELVSIVDDIEASIITSRQCNGGYGGVMDTACSLAVLAIRSTTPFDPWPAIAFLAARQTHDGLWPAEPLYPVPGKDHAPAAHGARPITTALCLYALARTRARLAREAALA